MFKTIMLFAYNFNDSFSTFYPKILINVLWKNIVLPLNYVNVKSN